MSTSTALFLNAPATASMLRELAEERGLVIRRASELTVLVDPDREGWFFRVSLRERHGRVRISAQDTLYGDEHLIEAVDSAMIKMAAELRGEVVRDAFDMGRPVDFVGTTVMPSLAESDDEARLQRCERMAIRLAEESQRLMRYAEELRKKERARAV